MKKGPNPQMFMLMAVGAIVLGGAACFFGYSGLSGAKANLRKLQADAKDARTLQKGLADSQVSLQDCTLKLQHLEEGVQDYAYVPTLLSELDKLGRTSGITVVGVRPLPKPVSPKKAEPADDGQKVKKKAYDELDIEVKGHGSYRSVLNFVGALGKFPKIVAARTVELTPKTEPGQQATLDVTIDLRAYIFPADQGPSAPAAKKTAMNAGSTHEG